MGLLSFVKDAGEKLFGHKSATPAARAATPSHGPIKADKQGGEDEAGRAIGTYIEALGLEVKDLKVAFDGPTSTVRVSGVAKDQATKEKVILSCGNVNGVEKVDDALTVQQPATPSQFHTVVSGDTLSSLAKRFYGNASEYQHIFEANQPMLKHPDKIYVGQSLRIPPKS